MVRLRCKKHRAAVKAITPSSKGVRVDPTALHESLLGVRIIGMRPERWRTMLVQDEARRNSGGGSKRC